MHWKPDIPLALRQLMTSAVMEMPQVLHANGSGADDHSAIAKYYEKLADLEIHD